MDISPQTSADTTNQVQHPMELQQASFAHKTLKKVHFDTPVDDVTTTAHTPCVEHAGLREIPPYKRSKDDNTQNRKQMTYHFPPALLDPDGISHHRRRFDRSALLWDSDLPKSSQIMAYAACWGSWISEIPNEEKREKLLDRVFAMASKAWYDAIALGHKADSGATKTSQSPRKRPTAPGPTAPGPTAPVEQIPAGLRVRPRSKKDIDPSKLPVLAATSHRMGSAWAVTVRELEAAGVSMSRVERRAAAEDLEEEGEELLNSVLDDYNGEIAMKDWYDIEEKTPQNPFGRDLQAYCIYEVLKSRANITQLESYYEKHRTAKQKENTQNRIDEEQECQDLFMALALELQNDDPRSPSPVPDLDDARQGSLSSVHATTASEVDQVNQLDSLISAAEQMTEESDPVYIVSTCELYDVSKEDILAHAEFSSTIEQFKHVMGEMLVLAQQQKAIMEDSRNVLSVHTTWDVAPQVADLDMLLDQKKATLSDLIPTLITEQEAAKIVRTSKAMLTQESDLPTHAMLPNPEISADNNVPGSDSADTKATRSGKRKQRVIYDSDEEVEEIETSAKKCKFEQDELDMNIASATSSHTQPEENSSDVDAAVASTDNDNSRPSLVITLRNRPEFSTTRLFQRQGFSYRYACESTLGQRLAMADVLNQYVQSCNPNTHNRALYGTYQGLSQPDDPLRTTIIHGVWDMQDGSRPRGFEAFYGGDRDYPAELEQAFMSETEEEENEEPKPKFTTPPPRNSSVDITRLEDVVPTKREPLLPTKATGTASKPKLSKEPNRSVYGKSSTVYNKGKITKPVTGSANSTPKIRLTVKPLTAPKRRVSADDTISRSRPRRQAARKSYAEPDLDDLDDDDYMPSK